jgi:hypothetical protein
MPAANMTYFLLGMIMFNLRIILFIINGGEKAEGKEGG